MKKWVLPVKWWYGLILIILSCASIAVFYPWRTTARQSGGQQQLYSRIYDGLGNEMRLPVPGTSQSEINSSIQLIALALHNRSSVELSEQTKNKLAAMESAVLNGTRRRITKDELTSILSSVLLQRVSTLTNSQIDSIASSSLRTLPDWARPSNSNFVMLRASGRGGNMTPNQFAQNAKSYRDSSNELAIIWRDLTPTFVGTEVETHLKAFSEAVPDQWGNVTTSGLTPTQAFLVAYSAAADDLFCDSATNLQNYLSSIQTSMAGQFGTYPNPAGRRAYGVNGYVYSTPLDLLFDEEVRVKILNSIEERNAL